MLTITPNNELAHWLIKEKLTQLEIPEIYSLTNWLKGQALDLDYRVINPSEERLIWQFLLGNDALAVYQKDFIDLIHLSHQWGIKLEKQMLNPYLDREKVLAACFLFQSFLAQHKLRLEVELLDHVVPKSNQKINFVGFNKITVQQKRFWQKLKAAGLNFQITPLQPPGAKSAKLSFLDAYSELKAALSWAINQPEGWYGIVLTDEFMLIAKRLVMREKVGDVYFSDSINLGDTFIGKGLMAILALPTKLTAEFWQHLLLSPLWGDFKNEFLFRNAVCKKLKEKPWLEWSCNEILSLCEEGLKKSLQIITSFWKGYQRERRSLKVWVKEWLGVLERLGFGKRVVLEEDQLLILEQIRLQMVSLISYDGWFPNLTGEMAIRLLKQKLEERLPRLEKRAKINFLSYSEALTVNFDGLWVTQCNEKRFPAPHGLNPLLDTVFFQRQKLDFPHASPAWELAHAQEILNIYQGYAKHLFFSYSLEEEGLEFSPLLRDIEKIDTQTILKGEAAVPLLELEPIPENFKPLGIKKLNQSILEAQSNCPFKAFLQFWLDLRIERTSEEEKRMERGLRLHHFLAWGSERYLNSFLAEAQLERDIDAFWAEIDTVEKRCLKNILIKWFRLDQKDFLEILETEKTAKVKIYDQILTLRIDRLDQMESGKRLLDYKTGTIIPKVSDWFQERLKNLQLPLYYLAYPEVTFLSIAHLYWKQIELKTFSVFELQKNLEKNLATFWQNKLDKIGEAFLRGECKVDPLDETTCEYCDFRVACRLI